VEVTFRRLVDDDLPVLHHWLNDPGVVQWWEGSDVSWEAVVSDYGSAMTDPVEHWIASAGGRDVGWIQCYAAVDIPEETDDWWSFGVDRDAAGIDYLLGEPGSRGRGLGSAMIRAFVSAVVFGRHPEWRQACAAPFAANVASWRALEKAGFRCLGVIEDDEGPCRLMAIDRPTDEFRGAGTSDVHRGSIEEQARHDDPPVEASPTRLGSH
jgi:aminoglycoside 6'-N-acetyltransferase